MKLKFTADDFKDVITRADMARWCNEQVEEALHEWKKSWVRVYGMGPHMWQTVITSETTHLAYLVEIEELVKKECEHVPIIPDAETLRFSSKTKEWFTHCSKCHCRLNLKWEVAE